MTFVRKNNLEDVGSHNESDDGDQLPAFSVKPFQALLSGKTARTCKKWNLDSGGFATASLNCGRYTWSSLLLPGEKFSTLLMQVSFFCPY